MPRDRIVARCADKQPEMRTVRAGDAQGEQPAQSGVGDHVRAIVEKAGVEPCLPDDRIRVDAEIPQGWGDLLGDSQMNVAGGSVRPVPATMIADGVGFPWPTFMDGSGMVSVMTASQKSQEIISAHSVHSNA